MNGEVWGRGAVDMLNLTASQAVALKALARRGWRPRGTLVYLAVRRRGGRRRLGAGHVCKQHWDALRADYLPDRERRLRSSRTAATLNVTVHVGEKGVAWRRLRVTGTPGHGSMPYGADNALVKAAHVVQPPGGLPAGAVRGRSLAGLRRARSALDPAAKAALRRSLTRRRRHRASSPPAMAKFAWSATHTTFSPNMCHAGVKTNVIPDIVDIEVDIRTIPGDNEDEVRRHLDKALGDLSEEVTVEKLFSKQASVSPTGTPLWDVLGRVVDGALPGREAPAAA